MLKLWVVKDNGTEVVSLVFRVLCRPHVKKLVAYTWFKTSYTTSPPGLFENPSRMGFPLAYGKVKSYVVGLYREANWEESVSLIRYHIVTSPFVSTTLCLSISSVERSDIIVLNISLTGFWVKTG